MPGTVTGPKAVNDSLERIAALHRLADFGKEVVRELNRLGSDFDGGSMPVGMEDCTKLPKITEALLRRGYKESDIRKILGENTARLLGDVERAAAEMRGRNGKA